MSITTAQRSAINRAKVWMRRGNDAAALNVLQAAVDLEVAKTLCDWCGYDVVTPVRDPEAVGWLGVAAATYCSQTCMDDSDERRINAAGLS